MKFLSMLLTFFIFCGVYATHDEKIAEEKQKKFSHFLDTISGKSSRTEEKKAVNVKKGPQEYPWQQLSPLNEEITSVVIDNNYKNTIKDKYYDEKDLNRFMLRVNSDPDEVQRYNKLVEAGKKYILIVYDLLSDQSTEAVVRKAYYFKRAYNWEVIGVSYYKSDFSPISTVFKECGFHKTIDFKAFPTLILADPKRGIYRKLFEGPEYDLIGTYGLEDLILKIAEEDK